MTRPWSNPQPVADLKRCDPRGERETPLAIPPGGIPDPAPELTWHDRPDVVHCLRALRLDR
jgi:hypothetical protein